MVVNIEADGGSQNSAQLTIRQAGVDTSVSSFKGLVWYGLAILSLARKSTQRTTVPCQLVLQTIRPIQN
jgi:hypothetical protein